MSIDIEIKVQRLIELSKVFSRTESELFTSSEIGFSSSLLGFSTNATDHYVNTQGGHQVKVDIKTKAENILTIAKAKAELAEKFDEYRKLQEDLSQYFKLLNNLKTK
jgi:hypothetical protein